MFNKHDLAGAGRWVRDHFSNWFANSFVMMGVFFIIIASIFIGMYFDGAYARRWSPEADAETIFRNYGWLISLAMVFFTAAGIKAFQEGARFAGGTMFIAGMFFTVLSATQSIGVVTLKAQQMMASADAFKKIEDTDTTRLDFLKAERQEIIDTRNSEIARIEKSIDAIRFDDIPGIPKADQDSIDAYNARIDVLRNEASAKIALIGDEIKDEMETPETAEEVAVAPARFDPGIEFWAYVLAGPNATDEYKEGLTYWYMLFWSIGCPVMGQMLAVYLVITRRTSENASVTEQKPDETNPTPDGPLQIDDEGYWHIHISKALNTRMPARTPEGMCNTYFGRMTPKELSVHLYRRLDERMELPRATFKDAKGRTRKYDYAIERGFLSLERPTYLMQEHIDFILLEGEYAPEEKPKQEVNGKDHSTDLTIQELGQDDADRPAA
ncbi:MAG: hypothetical protein HRT82_17510 [Henriciella sp.]|nr:hypothetical protein [Henriciella sp.]